MPPCLVHIFLSFHLADFPPALKPNSQSLYPYLCGIRIRRGGGLINDERAEGGAGGEWVLRGRVLETLRQHLPVGVMQKSTNNSGPRGGGVVPHAHLSRSSYSRLPRRGGSPGVSRCGQPSRTSPQVVHCHKSSTQNFISFHNLSLVFPFLSWHARMFTTTRLAEHRQTHTRTRALARRECWHCGDHHAWARDERGWH